MLSEDQVVQFHDVSNWQGDYRPTGPLFAKATQGASFVDKRYSANLSRTKTGGWPFAAYHYMDTRASIAAQAAHVLDVVGKSVPVMLDIERGGGKLPQLVALHDALIREGVHSRLVYLPHWYWQEIGSPDLRPLVERGLLLVSSNYPAEGYTDQGPGWAPYGRMTPMFWQWTDHPIDTVAFRGTVEQMRALLAIRATGAPKPPTKPPAPAGSHIVVPGDSLWSIAKGWDVTLDAVERANPKAGHPAGNFNVIFPGDVIRHP